MSDITNSSRAIFVLSLPRSGSSAVAGALHRMGVDMGQGHWQPKDASNPGGYYEDLRWQRLNKELAGSGYASRHVAKLPDRHREAYRDLFELCSRQALWGVKAPRMAFLFQHLWPLASSFCELRVVSVVRPKEEVIDSLQRHSEVAYGGARRMSRARAARLVANWHRAELQSQRDCPQAGHVVHYGRLVEDPERELIDLVRFVFEGTGIEPDLTEAIEWIQPGLRHHVSS